MTIYEKINNDITAALKSGDKFTLSTLRMFKSAMDQVKTNQRDIPNDDEVITTLRKQIKLRESSKEEYIKYERIDLADDLKKEIDILDSYLPEELSLDEIEKLIDEVFEELKPESIKDMGNIMKLMTGKVAGRYDMGKVSSMVREKLN